MAMSDEELLKRAETALEICDSSKSAEIIHTAATESIAASLLVIARNSLPITTSQEVPKRPEPNDTTRRLG